MELMNTNGVTITSNMIAELTGKRHTNVLRDIKTIIDNIGVEATGSDLSSSTYIDSKGETRPNFTLSKDGMMLVITKYSDVHRMKLIKYCRELEAKLKDSYMIENPIDRAKRWIEEELVRTRLSAKVQVQEQRLDTLEHSEYTYMTTEIAKAMNMSAIKLNKLLHEAKIQYKVNGTWCLYAKYADKGYVEMKQEQVVSGKIVYYTKWTEKGRQFILDMFA